mmetsp:Transcript_39176/g.44764  ORF Transcript_39176/g.44764 Transcript_39176/m.44764 type:complete len:86 (-) Transcript_39176:12-269(-)
MDGGWFIHPPDNPSIGGRDGANGLPSERRRSRVGSGVGVVKIELVRHAVGTETGTLLTIGVAVIFDKCENNIATPFVAVTVYSRT